MVDGSSSDGVFATAVNSDDRMVVATSTAAAQSMIMTTIANAAIC